MRPGNYHVNCSILVSKGMRVGPVYLESNFWHKVSTKKDAFAEVCRILARNEVHTNITKEEISNDTSLFQIWQDSGGRIYPDYYGYDEKRIQDNDLELCSTFLCDNAEDHVSNYGLLAIDSEYNSTGDNLFERKDIWISEDKCFNRMWKDVCPQGVLMNPFSNAMIINDKFICKEGRKEGLGDNLKSLLDALLPDHKQKIPYQLSLFCKIDDKNKGHKVYRDLEQYIGEIRSDLNVELSLYTNSNVHDRFVLTNSYIITVDAGFNIFRNGKVDNGTELSFYYPVARGNVETYLGKIKQVYEIHKASGCGEYFRNYWGERKNRLFELIK